MKDLNTKNKILRFDPLKKLVVRMNGILNRYSRNSSDLILVCNTKVEMEVAVVKLWDNERQRTM